MAMLPSQKDLATWQFTTNTHTDTGQAGILTIHRTILSLVSFIISTRSTHMFLGLSQSQAHASNCTHLSTAYSPSYLFI